MRNNVETLDGKLLFLAVLLADDHRHIHIAQKFKLATLLSPLLLGLRMVALLHEFLLFLGQIVLHLVIHSDGSVFIHAHHHALAQESTTRKMVGDVSGNAVESFLSLDDLHDA